MRKITPRPVSPHKALMDHGTEPHCVGLSFNDLPDNQRVHYGRQKPAIAEIRAKVIFRQVEAIY